MSKFASRSEREERKSEQERERERENLPFLLFLLSSFCCLGSLFIVCFIFGVLICMCVSVECYTTSIWICLDLVSMLPLTVMQISLFLSSQKVCFVFVFVCVFVFVFVL